MGSPEQPPGDAGQRPGEGDFDWESPGLGTRVNEIVDAVEREAAKLRQEAEQDAQQIRLQAQEEAQRYADQARQQTDAMAAQRVQRIQELSDALMARAEEVLERLDYAVPVKAGFENLVKALGETAERLASQDYSDVAQPSWEEVREATPPPATGAPLPGAGEPPPEHSPAFAAPGTATVPPPGGYPQPGEGAPTPGYPPPADQAIGQPPGAPPAGAWQALDDAHRIAIQMAASGSTRGEVEAHLAHAPAPARASVLDEIFGRGSPAETRVPWAQPPG